MDQIKIGKFIAELRRKKALTQESLGEKIGVTNKTISRWENGHYMPDIEMFKLLSQEFNVSINELLSGEKLSNENFRQKADENIIAVLKESKFSIAEKKIFFKKRWVKQHIYLLVVLLLILVMSIVLPILFNRQQFIGFAPLIALFEYVYSNNKMMTYVENKIYK